jgi:hypothetical protein
MSMRQSRKDKRRAIIKELARQSSLDHAPDPITKQEIHDHMWEGIIRWLISETSKARYFAPGQVIRQVNYDNKLIR